VPQSVRAGQIRWPRACRRHQRQQSRRRTYVLASDEVFFLSCRLRCLVVEAEAWRVVHQVTSSIGHTWFKGEDHQGTEHDDGNACQIQCHLETDAGAILAGVVVNDGGNTNGAVNHGEPQHGQIPDLPEWRRPFTGDETEVQTVYTIAHHQVREEMDENQDHQNWSGNPHKQPFEHFPVRCRTGRVTKIFWIDVATTWCSDI